MNRYQVVQQCSSNSLNSVQEFLKFRSLQALNYWNTCPLPSLTLILVLVAETDLYSHHLTFSIYTGREDKVGQLGQGRIVRTRQDSQDSVEQLGQSRIVRTAQNSQDKVGQLGQGRIVRTQQNSWGKVRQLGQRRIVRTKYDSQDNVEQLGQRRIVRTRQDSQDKVGPLGLSMILRTKYDGQGKLGLLGKIRIVRICRSQESQGKVEKLGQSSYHISRHNHVFKKTCLNYRN